MEQNFNMKTDTEDTAGEWLLPRAFKKESGEHISNGYNIYIKEKEVEKISEDEARIREIINDPSSVFVGLSKESLYIWMHQGIKYYIEPELNIINKIEQIMQPKESKTSWHFKISIAKSVLRLGAGGALIQNYFIAAGVLFILAEVLGILEEL
jgi:hypothetical protein